MKHLYLLKLCVTDLVDCQQFRPHCSATYLNVTVPFSVRFIVSAVSTEGPPSCPKGCDRCSEYNGCIKCKPKLFIFLERNDIRQIGVCLASCPVGYFGMRNPEGNNKCTQCKIDNCEACFNHNFCTKCKEGLYSHSGRCYVSCPPGQRTANETMECPASECELGEWSQWGSCMKKNKTCGFKKGSQSRVRVPLPQAHSVDASPALVSSQTCSPETERRKCVVTKTPCIRGKKRERLALLQVNSHSHHSVATINFRNCLLVAFGPI
uniref:R-spondin 1 n=1 Tax=Salarias fasciatus TaxID=181472 RepID=A0A672HC47_SALFA